MASHKNEHGYVAFPIADETLRETVVLHEEDISESNDECILPDRLTDDVNSTINDAQEAVELITEKSDDDDDNDEDENVKSLVYPTIYIKQENHHNSASGDDESMAVEALRQLGGMYPVFETKKHRCPKCSILIGPSEMAKHNVTCSATRLSCETCGENFDRKQDFENHVVCHQVDRPHACRTCGNLFRSRANLQTHISQIHRTEKPHKCTICGADFHRPSSLSNHMKIHTYVAGRALIGQSPNAVIGGQAESTRKWPTAEETQNTSVTPSTTTYDVQWSYNFGESVDALAVNEKIDTLQEFTVMPNGEVTQFEYPAQESLTSELNDQYDITMNNFTSNTSTLIKAETLSFTTSDQTVNYVDVSGESSKSHVCSHCGAMFSRATALVSHEKIHASKTWSMPVECEYCDKQFQDAVHLASHQTTCAKKLMQSNAENGIPGGKWGKHACPECGKKFTTKQKMFRHQWIHRKKTYSCEICGVQFEKQNQLDEHRLSAHPGDSPFTCTECGKSFVSRQGLWEHGRTHAGSPAHFHCDTCSKTFSSRQGYLIHHRTHTGERPYGCKFCWKAFRDGGTLRKHERIHTGERPHVCPLCSRAFNQKVVLREHVRWVHAAGKNETEVNGPPYPCPICSALNQDRDELCAHIVKHSDQMIAEAKAKTSSNAAKATKKKSRFGVTSGTNVLKPKPDVDPLTGNEETEALLSIAESPVDGADPTNSEIRDSMIVVANKGVGEIGTKDLDRREGDKRDLRSLVVTGQESLITKIRAGDVNVLHLIQSSKSNETLRLIGPSNANNTLHLITKRNESLPVVAIRNPQSLENYSCQMDGDASEPRGTRDNDNMADNEAQDGCLMDDETSHVGVEEVAHYIDESTTRETEEEDDGDEDDEMVCGICGDDFDDKNVLMEHVKIHI